LVLLATKALRVQRVQKAPRVQWDLKAQKELQVQKAQ
jgi:hypothetical protein